MGHNTASAPAVLEGEPENQVQTIQSVSIHVILTTFEPPCPKQKACKLAKVVEGDKITSNSHKDRYSCP